MKDQSLALAEALRSHDPEVERGKPLPFARIAKDYPDLIGRESPSFPVADFAELGYCAYKPWHWGFGTELKRPPRVQRVLVKGTGVPERKVAEELEETKGLPRATVRQLRDRRSTSTACPNFLRRPA